MDPLKFHCLFRGSNPGNHLQLGFCGQETGRKYRYHNILLQISFINLTRQGDFRASWVRDWEVEHFQSPKAQELGPTIQQDHFLAVQIRILAKGPSQWRRRPLSKAGLVWQLSQGWLHSLPSPHSSFLVGLSVGLGPLGTYQVHPIHWAPLYEMDLSWKQQVWGKKWADWIWFGTSSKSCKACKCLGGDFHIILKLLVFLPKAKTAAKSGGLKARGCPKDGKMKQTHFWSSWCACVCEQAE